MSYIQLISMLCLQVLVHVRRISKDDFMNSVDVGRIEGEGSTS